MRKDVRELTTDEKITLKKSVFEKYLGKDSNGYNLGKIPTLKRLGYESTELSYASMRRYYGTSYGSTEKKLELEESFRSMEEAIGKSLNVRWIRYDDPSGVRPDEMELYRKQKEIYDNAPVVKHMPLIKKTIIDALISKVGDNFSTNFHVYEYASEKGEIYLISGSIYTSGGYDFHDDSPADLLNNKNRYALVLSTTKGTDEDATAAAAFLNTVGANVLLSLVERNPQKKPGLHAKEKIAKLEAELKASTGGLEAANKTIGQLQSDLAAAQKEANRKEEAYKTVSKDNNLLNLDKATLNRVVESLTDQLSAALQARNYYIDESKKKGANAQTLQFTLEAVKRTLENASAFSKGSAIKEALKMIDESLPKK